MTQEQERLIEEHIHICKNKAVKWAKSQNVMTYDEILSTSYMALCKAAQAFDSKRGCHFVGFASICIDNAVRNDLKVANKDKKAVTRQDADLVIGVLGGEDVIALWGEDVEEIVALRLAIQRLPKAERELLEKYAKGATQRQLAAELSISQFAIHKQLQEIYEFLRFQMAC